MVSLKQFGKKLRQHSRSGQALIEYALLTVMIGILFGVALAATGPAIGNVFSNTVYNLLGQEQADIEDLAADRGESESFWATVQWVAENPPVDAAAPTNPVPPPPPSATPGPSPSPTPVSPSPPPPLTPTDPPPPTPRDFEHVAPWLDTIDNPEWWRVDSTVWIGGDDWLGEYFPNRTLEGPPEYEIYNGDIGTGEHRFNINFDWPSGTGPIEGWRSDDFSIRFTRPIYIPGSDPLTVRFTTRADDGVRLWLNYEAGCAAVNSGGAVTGSGTTHTSGCLIIDNWRTQGTTVYSVVRTLEPGFHTLQLDYFEATSGAGVGLAIEALSNQAVLGDDTIPEGGAPECIWYRSDTGRANSLNFIWEEAPYPNDFPPNMRCYLELRGSVDVSALTSPKLIFWDTWDLSAGTSVWVEVAEYHSDPTQRNWQRIDLHSGGTANYNMTRQTIDLTSFVATWTDKEVALRFGMQNTGGGGNRRWFVDDIELRDFDNSTRFFGVCSGTGATPDQRKANCGTYWDLDGPAQKNDFIFSGHWDLTADAGQAGTGWDSNAQGGNYQNNPEGSPRVHYVEFNGWIDLRPPAIPDAEGDDGPPQISFYHRWDIERGDSISLQWTRDAHDLTPDNWQNIETFVSVPTNGSRQQQTDFLFEEVLLNSVPNFDTQPFRMRFALIINNSREAGGWDIDQIYLERVGRERFTDYPFFDDAEEGTGNWLMEGRWGRTTSSGLYNSAHSFADSPNGNYQHGSNASMELRYVIDFNNDTPENNPEYTDNNPAGGNTQVAPATRPMLTFWHWRDLQSSDDLIVEWSKDRGNTWAEMWRYRYNSSTRRQLAWERVVVDLNFLVQGTLGAGDEYDDDTLIRFRLDARTNGSTADGVYIDNIEIRDYSETVHRLWDPSVTNPVPGDNIRYLDDMEGNWQERWHIGGDWTSVTYEQHNNLRSMHESPDSNTRHLTYQVLEMDRIIDLSGTTVANRPTLYWWNRYYVGSGDVISVEIARENPAYVRAAGETNHERQTGWANWTEVWNRTQNMRVDTWIREQVSLDTYVGSRIKVRFVFNAYSSSTNRYGWYIDELRIEHRVPTPIELPFYDPAQSMANWIGEGLWGLAPDQWRGSGGGPAAMGSAPWEGVYYDCERILGRTCNNYNDFNNILYENYGAGTFRPYQAGRDLQEFALDVYHDFRSTGRPPGGSGDNTWFDHYAARWVRPINVQAGDYTFIAVTDDGLRLKWECVVAGCTAPPGWNIFNRWLYQGRTVYTQSVTFEAGSYRLVLEWFESTGDATVILSAGKNNFSFTDSPKAGNGPAFPVVNSVRYGNSSLILRRPLRLTGTVRPVLEFFTRYRLGGTGRVEVTFDGGFNWTSANLTSGTSGFTCPGGVTCNATISGTYWPSLAADWQQRQLNLSNYVSFGQIGLRFRLETTSSINDGWYITDVQVNAASIAP